MKLRLSVLLIALAFCTTPASAFIVTTCTPNLSVDGGAIPASCYAAPLKMIPGTTWQLGAEDLPEPFWDRDGNDLSALVKFTTDQAIFTYQGSLSILYSELLVNHLPVFNNYTTPAGSTFTAALLGLSVEFRVTYPGYWAITYQFGSPNAIAFCIVCPAPMTPVPEPGSFAMFCSAVAVFICAVIIVRGGDKGKPGGKS